MDTFQDIDFSQLFYSTPVSNAETSPASSGYNNDLDKVTDFSMILQDMSDAKVSLLSSVCENSYKQEPVSNTTPASSGFNNNLDKVIDFSSLFQDLPDTKVTSLSCVCENSYKQEPVSNIELKPASSGCNDILEEKFMGQDISPLFQDFPDTKPNPLSCVECVYESAPVSNIELKPASSDGNDKKKRTVYTCTICNKMFSRNSHLMRHTRIHEKKRIVHTCSTCNKMFSRNAHLKRHIKIHEKKMIDYRCSVCDKTFRHKCYLKRHKEIHTRGKQFSCEVCLKPFSSKAVLKRHHLLHNSDEKVKHSFKCVYCNSRFTRNDQLKQHVRQYENSTYTCAQCNLKFCRMIELKAHIRDCHTVSPKFVHSAIRNPFCEKVKSFKRKSEFTEYTVTTFENGEDIPLDLHTFLTTLSSSVQNELNYLLFENKHFKCNFMLEANVTRSANNEVCTLYLNSNLIEIFSETMIREYIDQVFTEMIEQYSKMDWSLSKIIKLDVLCIKF